jgi:uncharacterized protein (TIGR03118 family)
MEYTCTSRTSQLTLSGLFRTTLLGILFVLIGASSPARAGAFTVANLVTDDQTVNAAQIPDDHLVNAWGISFLPGGPFWVSANAKGRADLYSVNPANNSTTKLGLEVTIPGDGTVTGQVSNPLASSAFNGDRFFFVSEDGTVSGWRGALGTAAEALQLGSSDNVYKGTALATTSGNTYLYAANFRAGRIDVLKGNAGAPDLTGNFTDPNLPAGYAPFNIQHLGDKLYVTYALQDAAKHDDLAGPGRGFVNVFDLQGNLLGRVGSQGMLNSPWGLAIAPSSFGEFAGDLLVGNFGDGHINVFNADTDSFIGQLTGTHGQPLMVEGLWGLTPGNDGSGGSTQAIYFSAGPGDEMHGLFGVIAPVSEPATLGLLGLALTGIGMARRRAR